MTTQPTPSPHQHEHYQPKGIKFFSQALGKEMILCTDETRPENGWLCYKHPDGQWVTLRIATQADREELARAREKQLTEHFCELLDTQQTQSSLLTASNDDLAAQVEKLTERAEKAEAARLDIKQRVTADEDFSADEIIELINGLLGRYAMSKAWCMEAVHQETMQERDDLRQLATRLAEVHGEVSDAIDGAEQLFESAFDHPCECGSGESCRHCSLVTQGNSKIWKVEKLTEAALADARKAGLLK